MEQDKKNKFIDQSKIGKFIAKCRKEKNLTQEDLALEFGITAQSVSKWENGKNSPDISIWLQLCEILGVGVDELLAGEKNESSNNQQNKEKVNHTIVESVKFYENKSKKKYFKILIFSIIVFLIGLLGIFSLYYFSNYNKVSIYNITGNDDLIFNGKIIFNPREKILLLNKVNYNDIYTGTNLELKAKSVSIKIMTNERIVIEYGDINFIDDSLFTLNEYLESIVSGNSELRYYDDYILKKEELNNLKFRINYIDESDNLQELEFKLNVEEAFANNSIFY